MKITERASWGFHVPEKDHPIWGLLKPVVSTLCLGITLSFTSSSFDAGETAALVANWLAHTGLEGFNLKKPS